MSQILCNKVFFYIVETFAQNDVTIGLFQLLTQRRSGTADIGHKPFYRKLRIVSLG